MQIIFKKTYSDPKSRIIIYEGTKGKCNDFGDIREIELPPNIKKTNGDPLPYLMLSEECLKIFCDIIRSVISENDSIKSCRPRGDRPEREQFRRNILKKVPLKMRETMTKPKQPRRS